MLATRANDSFHRIAEFRHVELVNLDWRHIHLISVKNKITTHAALQILLTTPLGLLIQQIDFDAAVL